MDEYTAMVLVKGLAPIEARKLDAPAFVHPPRTRPVRRAAVAVAALTVGVFGLWWQWPQTPSSTHATLALTPMPSAPDALTSDPREEAPTLPPGKGKGRLLFNPESVVRRQARGWALWSVEHGTGFVMPGIAWVPAGRFATHEACEADRAQRIQQMAAQLASQFQARSGVSMTEHGWKQHVGGLMGHATVRETVLLCAPFVEAS